jgi:16S rRNA (cytosine967-C5)-methyltransferase
LAARQRRLLAEAAAHVSPGGRLVYATCSSEPEENDAVVAGFLETHREYARIDPRDDAATTPLAPVLDADGTLRTDPARHGLEAFYAVAMRRRSAR